MRIKDPSGAFENLVRFLENVNEMKKNCLVTIIAHIQTQCSKKGNHLVTTLAFSVLPTYMCVSVKIHIPSPG